MYKGERSQTRRDEIKQNREERKVFFSVFFLQGHVSFLVDDNRLVTALSEPAEKTERSPEDERGEQDGTSDHGRNGNGHKTHHVAHGVARTGRKGVVDRVDGGPCYKQGRDDKAKHEEDVGETIERLGGG